MLVVCTLRSQTLWMGEWHPSSDTAANDDRCYENDLDESFLDFLPPSMLTDTARECGKELTAFRLEHSNDV
jgi:hypothetical protein